MSTFEERNSDLLAAPPKTKPDRGYCVLLQAAQSLHQPFSLSALVVAAFRLDPKRFSLPGFPHYPSDNAVKVRLYGRRGLLSRGNIKKVGDKYEVTGGHSGHGSSTRD